MNGLLGTAAEMLSDLTLLAYVLLIAPAMLVGFVFARRKMFQPHHKWTMTLITMVNWILILILMAGSYSRSVAPYAGDGLSDSRVWVPVVHLLLGGTAQLIATYLVIMMWTEKTSLAWVIPNALRVNNIKIPMRLTLTLWLLTVIFGVTVYITWYTGDANASDTPPPAATEEADPGTSTQNDETAEPAVTESPGDATTEPAADNEPVSTEEAGDNTAESEEVDEPVSTEEP